MADYSKGGMSPLPGSKKERYPINNATDLSNARHAIGRVRPGDKAKLLAHIKSRASSLGLGSKLKGSKAMPKNALGR